MTHKIILIMILSLPVSVVAQVAINPILWLDADHGVVQSGNKVSGWNDQSGSKNSAFQSTLTSQPSLLPNQLNGHASIKFHGGGEFLNCPPIFPTNSDYTITAVVRIDDSTAVNNIISGNSHAFFFGNSSYPRVVHGDFLFQEVSSLKVDSSYAIVTVRFSNDNAQAKIYVNGQIGDSLYIKSNSDSAIFIGAYQGAYTLNGALAELVVYDRQITEPEREQMELALRTKYAIPLGEPVPKPDSTFTEFPANFQLYPRASNDSATVPIRGVIYEIGFDSIYLLTYKNSTPIGRESKQLVYSNKKAEFSFGPMIHAELSEYRFSVHLTSPGIDTVIADRNNITCGDTYFICGESNSTFGYYNVPYQNEFCRTFGLNLSHNIRDTLWEMSTASLWGDGPSVSGWGLMLQKHLVEDQQIPSCFISGGVSGTILTHHLPDPETRQSLETIYGRLLFRAEKAKLSKSVKGIFWYHGELDLVDHYYDNFKVLYAAWKSDYPNLKKCYVVQLRPAFCVDLYDQPLRELFRTIKDSLPGIVTVSSTMFPHQDGCHFHDDGFSGIADELFPLLRRDFYESSDTLGIQSPDILGAYYSNPDNTEIALVFGPPHCGLSATADTTVSGIEATLKDYFYPDDEVGKINSLRFSGDTIFLKLNSTSTAKSISYLPDRYYNGSDSVFYEGPWLKSGKGIGAMIFYRFPIGDYKSSIVPPSYVSSPAIEIIPNPAHDFVGIRCSIPSSGNSTVALYDVLGKKIATIYDGVLTPGIRELPFDCSAVPDGEYICRLQCKQGESVAKMLVRN